MCRITCPLCIDKTGLARTAADQRHATVLPCAFAETSVEVIPCQFCIVDLAVTSVRIPKSRAIALAWDEPALRHENGLVEFS